MQKQKNDKRPLRCRLGFHKWKHPVCKHPICKCKCKNKISFGRAPHLRVCLLCEQVQEHVDADSQGGMSWDVVLDPRFCTDCHVRRKRKLVSPFKILWKIDAVAYRRGYENKPITL